MKNEIEIIDDIDPNLPRGCYSETKDGQVVVLISGMHGYVQCVVDADEAGLSARELNEKEGITIHQANAMRVGSTKGWDHEAARVDYWELLELRSKQDGQG